MLLPGLLNGKWHGLEGLVHLVVDIRHLGQHRARVPPAPGHLLATCNIMMVTFGFEIFKQSLVSKTVFCSRCRCSLDPLLFSVSLSLQSAATHAPDQICKHPFLALLLSLISSDTAGEGELRSDGGLARTRPHNTLHLGSGSLACSLTQTNYTLMQFC